MKHLGPNRNNTQLWKCLVVKGFPGGSDGKESACNAGDAARSLGWEDPLEKAMAIHSSILVWRIPWTDHGVAKSRTQLNI